MYYLLFIHGESCLIAIASPGHPRSTTKYSHEPVSHICDAVIVGSDPLSDLQSPGFPP